MRDASGEFDMGFNGQPKGEFDLPNCPLSVDSKGSCNENLTLATSSLRNIRIGIHSKRTTHEPGHWSIPLVTRWRECMMYHCVKNWKICNDGPQAYEAVGSHWMRKQNFGIPFSIFGGNSWWARSEFLSTLPSMYEGRKTRNGKLHDWDNRYEAEVWLGSGSLDLIAKSYHEGHPGGHG